MCPRSKQIRLTGKRRSFWGWGWEEDALDDSARSNLAAAAAARMGLGSESDLPPACSVPRIEEIELSHPRIKPPRSLSHLFTADPYERAAHTYGKSFRDVLRGLLRDFGVCPDLVAFPRKEHAERDLRAIMEWCGEARVALIPYGGGSSVVGGVEPSVPESYAGVVSLDMCQLSGVESVDRTSRAACILAGTYGPALEEALRPYGLTLRHFPQSFEFSTLGGWIATRSGGHYATLYTHIDDFVESLQIETPSGSVETRRLPASGAGPSPDRAFIGSEGILGVIVRAWMRLQDRPRYRGSAEVSFVRFEDGVEAVRRISQAGLHPSNCRLLDPAEALLAGGDGVKSILLLGFESADHDVAGPLDRAVELATECGGSCGRKRVRRPEARTQGSEPRVGEGRTGEGDGTGRGSDRRDDEGAEGAWRTAFLRAPYGRDALVRSGFVVETFETAITWNRFEELHSKVVRAVRDAIAEACRGKGWVACRFTHVYPDGPAPYYTVVALGHQVPQERLRQWDYIKSAASEAVIACGGTITHHHAIGRDHRRWYELQVPAAYRRALAAMKTVLDPSGILNPGALIPPSEAGARELFSRKAEGPFPTG